MTLQEILFRKLCKNFQIKLEEIWKNKTRRKINFQRVHPKNSVQILAKEEKSCPIKGFVNNFTQIFYSQEKLKDVFSLGKVI